MGIQLFSGANGMKKPSGGGGGGGQRPEWAKESRVGANVTVRFIFLNDLEGSDESDLVVQYYEWAWVGGKAPVPKASEDDVQMFADHGFEVSYAPFKYCTNVYIIEAYKMVNGEKVECNTNGGPLKRYDPEKKDHVESTWAEMPMEDRVKLIIQGRQTSTDVEHNFRELGSLIPEQNGDKYNAYVFTLRHEAENDKHEYKLQVSPKMAELSEEKYKEIVEKKHKIIPFLEDRRSQGLQRLGIESADTQSSATEEADTSASGEDVTALTDDDLANVDITISDLKLN